MTSEAVSFQLSARTFIINSAVKDCHLAENRVDRDMTTKRQK